MIINVTASRPGLGKSTLMISLASLLCQEEKKVFLLSDCLHLDERIRLEARQEKSAEAFKGLGAKAAPTRLAEGTEKAEGRQGKEAFFSQSPFPFCWARLASEGPPSEGAGWEEILRELGQDHPLICSLPKIGQGLSYHLIEADLRRARAYGKKEILKKADGVLVSFLAPENCCEEMRAAFEDVLDRDCGLLPLDAALQRQDLCGLSRQARRQGLYGAALLEFFPFLSPWPSQLREGSALYQVFSRFKKGKR